MELRATHNAGQEICRRFNFGRYNKRAEYYFTHRCWVPARLWWRALRQGLAMRCSSGPVISMQRTPTTLWPASSHHSMSSELTPLYNQWTHITSPVLIHVPLYDQQAHTTLQTVSSYHCMTSEHTPLYNQWTHTTLRPVKSHHSTTNKLTPLYVQCSHHSLTNKLTPLLQPVSSHHSTNNKLTPLYNQWTHTTLRPVSSHHCTTSELTPLCNTVHLRLHATYPHIHSIHKSRRSRRWTWEGDHCGLDHQWPHQYNEGKDRPEKLPSTWFLYGLWTGCTWAWTGHVSHLASVQLFLLSTTTPMHSTGSWLATMGPSCYPTWMTSSSLALPAKTPVRRPCTGCCWCVTSWASQWPLRSWRDPPQP